MRELDTAEVAYENGRRCYPADEGVVAAGGVAPQGAQATVERVGAEASSSTNQWQTTLARCVELHERGDAQWKALTLGLHRVAAARREILLREMAEQQRDAPVSCRDVWLFGG